MEFIGQKANTIWVTNAIERKTKRVNYFFVGNKTKANIQPLIDKLLSLYPKRIYTDKLNIYPSLIPKEIHRRFQYCTNRIERHNLTIRTHIKRLSRRTICCFKKQDLSRGTFTYLFLGINNFLNIKLMMLSAAFQCPVSA